MTALGRSALYAVSAYRTRTSPWPRGEPEHAQNNVAESPEDEQQGDPDTHTNVACLAVRQGVAGQAVARARICGDTADDPDQHEDVEGENEPNADVVLDLATAQAMKDYLTQRGVEKADWGEAWIESQRFFTREGGEWLHPGLLSEEFERLVQRSQLPPVRLHDLRHGAATIALAAGTDMKVIQTMLRHSQLAVTADTYTSVLPQVSFDAAEAAAELVPRGRRNTSGLTSGSQ